MDAVTRAPAPAPEAAGRSSTRRPASAADDGGERLVERAVYWGYRGLETLLNALPRRVLMPAAAAVGNVAYDLAGPKSRLTRENLARPMGLDPEHPRVRAAARRAFRNYAKYLVDMMRMGEMTAEQFLQRIFRILPRTRSSAME